MVPPPLATPPFFSLPLLSRGSVLSLFSIFHCGPPLPLPIPGQKPGLHISSFPLPQAVVTISKRCEKCRSADPSSQKRFLKCIIFCLNVDKISRTHCHTTVFCAADRLLIKRATGKNGTTTEDITVVQRQTIKYDVLCRPVYFG